MDLTSTCETTPRHARCAADPETYDRWSAASVVSKIEVIEGEECCFDLTGDGKNNNALGALLKLSRSFGAELDFNKNIADSIASGSLVLLVEHQHIAQAGGPFAINYYLGEQDGAFTAPVAAGGNAYRINAASLSQGVWPGARMGQATHDGAALQGGPGTVAITTELLGPPVTLHITAAQISADIDAARTTFDEQTGVALTGGKLGGAVRLTELFDSINDVYADNCSCAPIPDDKKFISYDAANLKDASCSAPENDTSACDMNDTAQGLCVSVYDICGLVKFAKNVADVDADDVQSDCRAKGTCNAISLATTFEAAGARITGTVVKN